VKLLLKGILVLAVISFILAAGTLIWFARSGRLQNYARDFLVTRIEKASGLRCTIQRFETSPWLGKFVVQGFSLGARPGNLETFSLSVDEISGSLSVTSLWLPKVQLNELNLIRPQIRLSSGQERTPWNPEHLLNILRFSLGFGVGRIVLREGALQVNNQIVPFDLSAKDLRCEMRYSRNPSSYKIHLAYKEGSFLIGQQRLIYDLDVDTNLTLDGLEIESFELVRHRTRLSGKGYLTNWNSPALNLHVEGSANSEELVPLAREMRDATGDFAVNLDFNLGSDGLNVAGKYQTAASSYREVPITSFEGAFQLQKNVLSIRNAHGRIGNGVFEANGAFELTRNSKSLHRFNISVTKVPLKDIGQILHLSYLNYSNPVTAQTQVAWKKAEKDLEFKCKAELLALPGDDGENDRTLQFLGNVEFSFSREGWNIDSADLSSPHSRVMARGQGGGQLQIKGSTAKLSEPLGILRNFSKPLNSLISQYPDILEIRGNYDVDGRLWLARSDPVIYRGRIKAREGEWRSFRVDDASAEAEWSGDRVTLHSLDVDYGKQSIQGRLALDFSPNIYGVPGIVFQGSVAKISLAGLGKYGIEITPDLDGWLSGTGSLSNAGGAWGGKASFRIDDILFRHEKFDSLTGQAQLKNDELQIIDWHLNRNSASLNFKGDVNLKDRQVHLSTRLFGMNLAEVSMVRERIPEFSGSVSGSAEIKGTFDKPSVTGNFELSGLHYGSLDLGKGSGSLELLEGVLEVKGGVQASLGDLSFQTRISTEPGYQGAATMVFSNINVQNLIAGKVPALLSDVSTALQGKLEISGKFADFSAITMSGELDGARFKSSDYEIHNGDKIRFTIENKALLVDKVNFVGEGTSLFLNGTIPLDDSARLDLNLSGNLDLRLLQSAAGKIRLGGSAGMSVRAAGKIHDPQIIGQATLSNARLDRPDSEIHLSSVQGRIIFSRNLVRLEDVKGSVLAGSFEIQGSLEHQNAQLRNMNLQILIRKARLSYPKDFRTTINADLNLKGGPDSQTLGGDINVLQANYLKSFSLLERFSQEGGGLSSPISSDAALLGLRLDLDIHSDNGLYIENELVQLRGGLRLSLRGTPTYPSLTGRIESADGTIYFRGNRFDIIHARADFLNRSQITPVLEVRAEANIEDYRLIMDVNGDLSNLKVNVTSDPPLSTVDIVSLLTMGISPATGSESARSQSENAGMSAASILSESLTGVIGKRVQRIFGLETFRVDPFLTGAGNDPTARVTVAQRLAKDVTVTFSRNLSTNEEQIVVLEYDINRNFSVIASRDENGKYGLDFRFRKNFR
jgi:translocation and assembly module TamB